MKVVDKGPPSPRTFKRLMSITGFSIIPSKHYWSL